MRPEVALRWERGRIVGRPESVPDDGRAILDAIVKTLNVGSAEGYLTAREDFDLSITDKGRRYVEDQFAHLSRGCVKAEKISADWRGFHLEANVTCTEEELDAAFRDQVAYGKTASLGLGVLPSRDSDPLAAIFGEDFGCLLSLTGISISAVGLLLLMAFPPAGLLAWVLWGLGGAGFVTTYVSTVDNCTGILAAKERFHLYGNQYYTTNCTFAYYASYRYDRTAGRNVPTAARWNC
jgi:hypothetical protein